jgi:hypothetical protein
MLSNSQNQDVVETAGEPVAFYQRRNLYGALGSGITRGSRCGESTKMGNQTQNGNCCINLHEFLQGLVV